MKKIKINLKFAASHWGKTLKYIYCYLQSQCLDVDLSSEDKNIIERRYESQINKLLNRGMVIEYNGPDFRNFGDSDINYILALKHVLFKSGDIPKLKIFCYAGKEDHEELVKENNVKKEFGGNGFLTSEFIYGGFFQNGKFKGSSPSWNLHFNEVRQRSYLLDSFPEFGRMINFYVLKHFGLKED